MKRSLVTLVLLGVLLLASCEEGYTEQSTRTESGLSDDGGWIHTEIGKANGATTKDLELEGLPSDEILEVDVMLFVGQGSYQIELLGEDEQATLTLQARDGQNITGHGQMATDSFGEAGFRVTAVEAEGVEYAMQFPLP